MGLFDKSSKYWANPNRKAAFSVVIDGLKAMWQDEINFRIHIGISFLVVLLGIYFQVSLLEWQWLIIAIGLVLTLEVLNTALESLVDLTVGETWHPLAKKVKDLGAVAVFLMAGVSVLIGAIIFLPYVLNLLK